MSPSPISLSPDLQRLVDDGFEVAVESGHLVVRAIPYVNAAGEVKRGILVSKLDLAGDRTSKPRTHVVMFGGEYPCDRRGRELEHIRHGKSRKRISNNLAVDFSFSSKPSAGYSDYHHKMSTYADLISGHAEAVDPSASARTRRVIESSDAEEIFNYVDTASSRSGTTALSDRFRHSRVAIAGLGGTGSYVLDFVAKTPVREIHLFDDDVLLQHNAFRSPGAPTVAELKSIPQKVCHHAARYAPMRKGIIEHVTRLDATNVDGLAGMDMVFVCVDRGDVKVPIVDALERLEIAFIDVGMGLEITESGICGIVRTTTSTPRMRGHVRDKQRIAFGGGGADGVYSHNVQIAELNALNAALAVIKWKKLAGFYLDLEEEHFTAYTLDGNAIVNEDQS